MIVNGVKTDLISVNDRGFQFGDGLFETMRIIKGKPQDLDLHLIRMIKSCELLKIPFPENWHIEILESCQKEYANQDGILKLILTRGDSLQGLKFNKDTKPNRIIKFASLSKHIKEFQQKGVKVKICQTKINSNLATCGLKSLSFLENVLASLELNEEFQEGLMLNQNNEIIEGTSSNFLAIKNNDLISPNLDECGLKGITRDKVIKISQNLGMNFKSQKITDYKNFDACFVTNSVIGLYPIIQIENHKFQINQKLVLIANKLNY